MLGVSQEFLEKHRKVRCPIKCRLFNIRNVRIPSSIKFRDTLLLFAFRNLELAGDSSPIEHHVPGQIGHTITGWTEHLIPSVLRNIWGKFTPVDVVLLN